MAAAASLPLLQKVTWGVVSARKDTTACNRPGVVDTDISGEWAGNRMSRP